MPAPPQSTGLNFRAGTPPEAQRRPSVGFTIFETLGIRRTTLYPYLTEDDIASSSHRDRNQSLGDPTNNRITSGTSAAKQLLPADPNPQGIFSRTECFGDKFAS